MSEEQSNLPSPSSELSPEDDSLNEAIDIAEIAAVQSESSVPNTELFEREQATYEGNTPEAAMIVQLALQEQEKKKAELQNQNLQFQNQNLKLKNESLERKNNEEVILYDARREYTRKLFNLTISWLLLVGACVLLTAFSTSYINNPDCQLNCVRFKLSENVLIAFITTTTATVIGIFIIVAKWLFPAQKEEKEEKKEK